METTLDNATLANLCLRLVEAANSYDLAIYPLIRCMHLTGLRINEVYQMERWSFPDADTIRVTLEKSSGTRDFTHAQIPDEYYNLLIGYPTTGLYFSIRQVNYFIRGNTGWAKVRVGGKEIESHLFRYNYVRQLYDGGMNISDIKNNIVHSSMNVTSGYLFNPVIGSDIR